jgi:SNF2 family DNA or RNA helicase
MTTSHLEDNAGHWIIANDRVALMTKKGETVFPSAADIWAAEFADQQMVHDITTPRRPSATLPGLRFSRFPPDLRIAVTRPSQNGAVRPTCKTCVFIKGALVDMDVRQRHNDQLISNGVWYSIPHETVAEVTRALDAAGIGSLGYITLRQYLHILNSAKDYLLLVAPPCDEKAQPTAEDDGRLIAVDATLYPYQVDGVQWLSSIAKEGLGCILGDEMGLGKTLQVIAILQHQAALVRRPCLVIASATLMENWRRELQRFAPTVRVHIHRGPARTGFPNVLSSYDIVLTTYETVVRDELLLRMIPWNVVVVDEAQAIKSPDAQRTLAIKRLPRHASIAVTGTPVENSLRDMWSLMDFAIPGYLGPLEAFESRYKDDPHSAKDLEPAITPLLLRRRVLDVANDLPDRIDIPQPIDLSPDAASRYESLRQQTIARYGKSARLVVLSQLRMFCTHPVLVFPELDHLIEHSTKYARLNEILEEIVSLNEKALVFTSYTQMADRMAQDIRRRWGLFCEVIDGRTPIDKRQPCIDRFTDCSGSDVLVLNPRAAGAGLNITAATHVIHYNLEWNPAVEDQASARAHRRGQNRPVTVHRLYHANTVEEVINQRMDLKRAMAAAAVAGTSGDDDDGAAIIRALTATPLMEGLVNGT